MCLTGALKNGRHEGLGPSPFDRVRQLGLVGFTLKKDLVCVGRQLLRLPRLCCSLVLSSVRQVCGVACSSWTLRGTVNE